VFIHVDATRARRIRVVVHGAFDVKEVFLTEEPVGVALVKFDCSERRCKAAGEVTEHLESLPFVWISGTSHQCGRSLSRALSRRSLDNGLECWYHCSTQTDGTSYDGRERSERLMSLDTR